jgi:hypothetical protein
MQRNELACSSSGLRQKITSVASDDVMLRDVGGRVLVAPGGAADIYSQGGAVA